MALAQLRVVPSLREIDVACGTLASTASLREVSLGCTQLRVLRLAHCGGFSDDGLAVVAALRRLEVLDIRYCAGVTDRGIAGFCEANRSALACA